jgi:hypothetical protein
MSAELDRLTAQIVAYVEGELEVLVARGDGRRGPLVYMRAGTLCWSIGVSHGGEGEYRLLAEPSAESFFVTHSNARVGVMGLHHYTTTGTKIPFSVVSAPFVEPVDFLERIRRPLAEILWHIIDAYPPDVESPT